MTSRRAVRDEITNVLDYLLESDLAVSTNVVAIAHDRVTWQSQRPGVQFFSGASHATIGEYRRWVSGGHYSAALRDGSLLQLTYDFNGNEIRGHRLAYVPCPYLLDEELLSAGHPVLDVLDLYDGSGEVALRSPIRFDYDPKNSKAGHPAAHMTLNNADCRIACIAPLHVLRFTDFVYRNFYSALWRAHESFFAAAGSRHLSEPVIVDDDRFSVHLAWDPHLRGTA